MGPSTFHLTALLLTFTCFGYSFSSWLEGSTKISSSEKEISFPEKSSLMKTCEEEHPGNLSLDLSNLGLRRIKDKFISNPHVTCLNLEGNEIEEGNLRAFRSLSNLAYLNLANNKIDVVNFLSFGTHPNLKTLVLDNAGPRETRDNYDYYSRRTQDVVIEAYLPKLENLYIRNISARSIASFFIIDLPKLTHLYLSDSTFQNGINEFLENIPANLTHLYIERCNIMITRISNLSTSLVSLSLDGNNLPCLGSACMDFGNFPRLKYLSIANNGINLVSSGAFEFNSDLIYLDMSQNFIQELPEETFYKSSNLEVLKLNRNQLSKIPDLCSLKKLTHLYINYNSIEHVYPNSFGCVENLKFLSLSGNSLKAVSKDTFNNLKNLIALDLSENKLSKLEYRSSLNLKYLFINDNSFTSIESLLLGKTCLDSLILVNNPIGTLKSLSLKFLPENTTIYINEHFPKLEKDKLFNAGFFF